MCSIVEHGEICGRRVVIKSRGWCKMHYRRWQRHGDPLTVKQIQGDDEARVLSYIQVGDPGECWPWTGSTGANGYGYTRLAGKQDLAHRAAYILFVGPIPEGMDLDHLCHVHDECPGGDTCPHRRCCNWISHLGPATSAANTLRGSGPTAAFARRDRCAKGHIYTEASSYLGKQGDRRCRICRREYKRSGTGRQAVTASSQA
jgi:hypothetical protein